MFKKINHNIENLIKEIDTISIERSLLLDKIAEEIKQHLSKKIPLNLIFVCTHNSRRSHFGQFAALLASEYFSVEKINVFSGGTEVTEFNSNAINTLLDFGFEISKATNTKENPAWIVSYSSNKNIIAFSKLYNDTSIPKDDLIAIMTCEEAAKNCPIIFGAIANFNVSYEDPKIYDNTPFASLEYNKCFKNILVEMLYLFSKIH
jgi:arsenate reductase